MTESLNSAVLAVDGGGTRCRVACEASGIVQSVETGAANVSTDFDASIRQIQAGFAQMAQMLGVEQQDLVRLPAFVGLAGVTDDRIASRVKASLGLAHARVMDDRPAALRGALGAQDGLIVHCGTGSFIASQKKGVMRFAGGWGPVLGDEASAQWVGRRALAETLDAVDNVHASSALTQELMTEFGGAAGIVDFAGDATPREFGALAPKVTSAAVSGDIVATRVMQAGAAYVTEMIQRLGWRRQVTICLTGGIAPHYAEYLPTEMQSAIQRPLGEPLAGALALAKEVQNEHR
ncbi:BadF/BadG/BcrA/BcrD ATPase family protein [Ruegeria sp. Ofav3-42]|uniref:BadF/BadG/BcrA/BcrD ATPase family protein n=1 Tax=Ruegeria sp. Ofav3-42 TaxID=2917759 RepID=UPI001EF4BC72|nr:BadF/BadG/BcrA/BcrD ATPase family protein [Ruegeria sp. Ofav3-42]MCG7519326.1 ATPase [Ruegeria sp. Ofav3-42]